ncbi:phosphatase PAP2 family protein [Flavobacteriaceae bacterium]|nr:phosphatase PAP2 family protein [Flavobacteriaceae bacterium]MDB2313955.1 phosphatase PAP2 family protein [Flavobacteriaceae bacterium]
MTARFKFIFKLRLEEFLAVILSIPMVFFMVIYYDKEGFRASNVERFLITGLVFFLFLGIIKLKNLKVLLKSKIGRWIKALLDFLRETLPFLFCISIYTNMHDMVHLVNPNDVDASLIAWDQYLLGFQPAIYLESFITPELTDFMYFSYSSFLIYIIMFTMYLYVRKNHTAFRETLVSVILTFYIGYIGYVIFPAVGPKFTMSHLFETSLSGSFITDRLSFLMNYEISEYTRRDCFPSLHNGVIFLILLFAFKHQKRYAFLFLPFAIALFISTLYLRYHYFVDMIAGFLLAIIVFYLGPLLNNWWEKKRLDYK